MSMNKNIPTTSRTNNNQRNFSSRVRLVLASGCLSGTILMGGLLGFHGTAAAATHTMTQSQHVASAHDSSYVQMARSAASAAGISPDLFVRQIQQESGFNPSAGSPAGAQGIAQFMPGTAASMGVNPWDPTSALPGAARLMAGLSAQYGGNYAKALAAYNAGPGAVNSAVAQGGGNWLAFTPAETQNYVHIIMG